MGGACKHKKMFSHDQPCISFSEYVFDVWLLDMLMPVPSKCWVFFYSLRFSFLHTFYRPSIKTPLPLKVPSVTSFWNRPNNSSNFESMLVRPQGQMVVRTREDRARGRRGWSSGLNPQLALRKGLMTWFVSSIYHIIYFIIIIIIIIIIIRIIRISSSA